MFYDKIEDLIKKTLENVSELTKSTTIIGNEIKCEDGSSVIPISKLTMSIILGSGEYGTVKMLKTDNDLPSSGVSNTIVSLKPICFLHNSNNGVKLLETSNGPYEKIASVAENIFNSMKEVNDEKE